ncbi:DUF4394 domain-containing protein [Leptolyngbya sp. FACHB-711]|uniref:DUF4394 domain-containing protein n=1 Tax=Leptolyngbya sp. FACHB-711 TaxID=2692813 RepID=UPI001686A0FD|nr:DUF4394 domain-containing protein [Leptolyngbya sp. FACHB-711]MBD2025235.1 DUF4394 domain-containing protein [Leptolyngbya sp. FACHB-711]
MVTSNNSFNRAQNLGVLQSGIKTIGESANQSDRVDFFSFRVTNRSRLQGGLLGLRSDVNVTLFDRNRKRIAVFNNVGKRREIIDAILERGRYFIKTTLRSGETRYRLSLFASPLAAPDPATASFVGLTTDNSLAFFNSNNLLNVTRIGVTGLQPGENLLGIDFRPVNRQLFGLGSSSRLYRIDPATGAATAVNAQPFEVPLSGSSFGFDFNPSVDRIRVVSDAGQNLRLVPDTGTVVDSNPNLPGVQADSNLNGATTSIETTAYTDNFFGVAPITPPAATTQYTINTVTDQLFIQNPPNAGTQTLVGPLGVDFSLNTGFDIVTLPVTATTAAVNTAFALSNNSLYIINLTTGAASLPGEVRDNRTALNFRGLAVRS